MTSVCIGCPFLLIPERFQDLWQQATIEWSEPYVFGAVVISVRIFNVRILREGEHSLESKILVKFHGIR